ncbi:MAG TPA: Nudix family hydrolase [Acidiferrobacterales bacterium]
MPQTETVIDAAVAVVQRADGRVLLARRPAGKAYAGYWEFPGGKIEDGESPRAALRRELHEEVGIDAESVHPWITLLHVYPEKTVRLHFYRVPAWRGEPHGREDQELSWEDPAALAVAPLLPANTPVLRALGLPAVYAITHAAKHGVDGFIQRLDAALARGVKLVQVREPGLAPPALEDFARRVVARAHARGARVLVNGDAELARRAGADGVHLPGRALTALAARPDLPLCAASCHDAAELARAATLGVDFAVLSPVLPTPSHPDAPGMGWERFAERVRDCPVPVYALGGMRPDLLDTALSHGAHGIALLSGIW